jgi:hypothetical protein
MAYRADQVGSLLRPPELLAAREATPPDPGRLRALEDQHILRVVTRQRRGRHKRRQESHAAPSCQPCAARSRP